VLGKPCQVEAGEYDTGDTSFVVLEAFGKMDHSLTAGRINPIISDGKPGLCHGALKKGLLRDR
jgi:hypothetical protein